MLVIFRAAIIGNDQKSATNLQNHAFYDVKKLQNAGLPMTVIFKFFRLRHTLKCLVRLRHT